MHSEVTHGIMSLQLGSKSLMAQHCSQNSLHAISKIRSIIDVRKPPSLRAFSDRHYTYNICLRLREICGPTFDDISPLEALQAPPHAILEAHIGMCFDRCLAPIKHVGEEELQIFWSYIAAFSKLLGILAT